MAPDRNRVVRGDDLRNMRGPPTSPPSLWAGHRALPRQHRAIVFCGELSNSRSSVLNPMASRTGASQCRYGFMGKGATLYNVVDSDSKVEWIVNAASVKYQRSGQRGRVLLIGRKVGCVIFESPFLLTPRYQEVNGCLKTTRKRLIQRVYKRPKRGEGNDN